MSQHTWRCGSVLVTCLLCVIASTRSVTSGSEVVSVLPVNVSVDQCDNITITCSVRVNASQPPHAPWWSHGSTNLSSDSLSGVTVSTDNTTDGVWRSVLMVRCVSSLHHGQFTCHASNKHHASSRVLVYEAPVLVHSSGARSGVGHNISLMCVFSGRPAPQVSWHRGVIVLNNSTQQHRRISVLSMTTSDNIVESRLMVYNVSVSSDHGTVQCSASNPAGNLTVSVPVTVVEVPRVHNVTAVSIGKSRMFISWRLDDGNTPLLKYSLKYRPFGSSELWSEQSGVVVDAHSHVLSGLTTNTVYQIHLSAENSVGQGNTVLLPRANNSDYVSNFTTASTDPVYKPLLSLKAATSESLTVSWSPPPTNSALYNIIRRHHDQDAGPQVMYRLIISGQDVSQGGHVRESEVNGSVDVYVWENLDAVRTYTMSVRVCVSRVDLCGLWSDAVNGTTLLDKLAQPRNVSVQCELDRQRPHTARALVQWQAPVKTKQTLEQYTVSVRGEAEYRDGGGGLVRALFGPEYKALPVSHQQAIFSVQPNTNYTALVCADSASGRCMGSESASCMLGAGPPDLSLPSPSSSLSHAGAGSGGGGQYHWWRVRQDARWLLLLQVDRVDERNGPVCCYRVVVVRLSSDQAVSSLPSTDHITVHSYQHVQTEQHGAYLADMFEHDFVKTRYVTVGDSETLSSPSPSSSSGVHTPSCSKCRLPDVQHAHSRSGGRSSRSRPARAARTVDNVSSSSSQSVMNNQSHSGNQSDVSQQDSTRPPPTAETQLPHDGPLDENARYTAFVQFLVRRGDGVLSVTNTHYLPVITPAPPSAVTDTPPTLAIVLGLVLALSFCVLLLIVVLCALRHYGKDVVSISGAVRLMMEHIRGQNVSSPVSAGLTAIARVDLVAAFQQRHDNGDAGFRREFECLPQCFHDRTTYASEALENSKKNRYPDIRAYDQTRVKLSHINGVQSTEYINANFVYGYKERKKFICAQGPLEVTVEDFWRMVWEQRCCLLVMLTNLEEVGRNKCAKYWPDDQQEAAYGCISVSLTSQHRYSDYAVRVLSVSRARGDASLDTRCVTQLHYLTWRDFMAPEHAAALLSFIRRINAIYTTDMGPILVHCSAGVGRTGTLVAIDSLLQQLDEEQHVSVFNTVSDLRHQRNYLVQSLKQYVFVYRTLMEQSQFGNTEISRDNLATVYQALCQPAQPRRSQNSVTKLSLEFQRLGDVIEERRSFVVGDAEENSSKNRHGWLLPYDVNRVILTPLPARPAHTYINASFIQGYDADETFVLTQHPLTSTQSDFWRMVADLDVRVIVVLSTLHSSSLSSPQGSGRSQAGGDNDNNDDDNDNDNEAGQCVRYWPSLHETLSHDHLHVTTEQYHQLALPSRDRVHVYHINVTNNKSEEVLSTHLVHFVDWPSASSARNHSLPDLQHPQDDDVPRAGSLPQSGASIFHLIEKCRSLNQHQSAECSPTPSPHHPAPIIIQCSDGGERSSVVACLFVLLRQLRVEQRVDIFQTVRRVRAQRQGMMQHLTQYDYLYRSLVECITLVEDNSQQDASCSPS